MNHVAKVTGEKRLFERGGPGGPGRPRGVPDKGKLIRERIFECALRGDTEELDRFRITQPGRFWNVVARLLPKELQVDQRLDVTQLVTADVLCERLAEIRRQEKKAADGNGATVPTRRLTTDRPASVTGREWSGERTAPR